MHLVVQNESPNGYFGFINWCLRPLCAVKVRVGLPHAYAPRGYKPHAPRRNKLTRQTPSPCLLWRSDAAVLTRQTPSLFSHDGGAATLRPRATPSLCSHIRPYTSFLFRSKPLFRGTAVFFVIPERPERKPTFPN